MAMPAAAPAGAPGGPKGPKALQDKKRKQLLIFGGAAAAVAAIALYMRSQGGSGSAAGDNPAADSAATPDTLQGSQTPFSFGGDGDTSGFEESQASLQNQLQQITAGLDALQQPAAAKSGVIPGTDFYLHEHPKKGSPYITVNGKRLAAQGPKTPPSKPGPKPRKPKPKPRPSRPIHTTGSPLPKKPR